jgi:hypothetical protein
MKVQFTSFAVAVLSLTFGGSASAEQPAVAKRVRTYLQKVQCDSNTYLANQLYGEKATALVDQPRQEFQSGAFGRETNWKVKREGELIIFDVVSKRDHSLIVDLHESPRNSELEKRADFKAGKLPPADGIAQYKLEMKANVPFHLVVHDIESIGFEIPDESSVVTCNTPLAAVLGELRPKLKRDHTHTVGSDPSYMDPAASEDAKLRGFYLRSFDRAYLHHVSIGPTEIANENGIDKKPVDEDLRNEEKRSEETHAVDK